MADLRHADGVRDAIATLAVQSLDVAGRGYLVILNELGDTVATLRLSRPAFAAVVQGRAVANAIAADPRAPGGRAARAELRDGAGVARLTCDVTAVGGGGAIQLPSLEVEPGRPVGVSTLVYQAPP